MRAIVTNMAGKVACARAFFDILHKRVSLTALSTCRGIPYGVGNVYRLQDGHSFVSVSNISLSPQPPKKPPGAFITFFKERNSEMMKESPNAGLTERAKLAGQMWRELDPEEKNQRNLAAKEEFQLYREKYFNFVNNLSDSEKVQILEEKQTVKEKRARRSRKMELKKYGRPKHPPNSYMIFVRSSRLERGNAKTTTFIKGLSDYWRQMPAEEKRIYEDDARIEKEKYEQEMKEWEEEMKEIGREDLIRNRSRSPRVRSTKAKKSSSAKAKKKAKSKKSKGATGKKVKAATRTSKVGQNEE